MHWKRSLSAQLLCVDYQLRTPALAVKKSFRGVGRQFICERKKPTLLFKAAENDELGIGACLLGKRKSMNDTNIINPSPVTTCFMDLSILAIFRYTVIEKEKSYVYFSIDGIYPPYSIFDNIIAEERIQLKNEFAAAQEALQKNVENSFCCAGRTICPVRKTVYLLNVKLMV